MPKSENKRSHPAPKSKQASPARIEEALKIGDVAKALGVSPSMVRAWEKLGLTRPARTNSKYRLYSNDDLKTLRRAIYLRRVQGLNAPAIVRQLKQEGLMPETPPAAPPEIAMGPKFRKLRLQRGEPLSAVAKATGVSVGFLSNLERSHSEASVGVLRKLAQYYGLNILDFFTPIEGTTPLVRPKDRKILEGGPGVRMELLASGKITMEPHLFRVAPGAGSGDSYSHQGEEFLHLISGRLNITLAGEEYELKSGDSFYFGSHIQHTWHNPGKTEAVVLWINTPPTF